MKNITFRVAAGNDHLCPCAFFRLGIARDGKANVTGDNEQSWRTDKRALLYEVAEKVAISGFTDVPMVNS